MKKKFASVTLDTAFYSVNDNQQQNITAMPTQPVSPSAAIMATTCCSLLAAPPTRIDLL
jgi:hypothetical protein